MSILFSDEEIRQLEIDLFNENMAIINSEVDNIRNYKKYPPELQNFAANRFRTDAVCLLEQFMKRKNWFDDFGSLLRDYQPLFNEAIINWCKRDIVNMQKKVNKNPTDKLYCLVIKNQFEATSEDSINPNLPILPFYKEQLTLLMDNLKERRAVLGSFDKQETVDKITQPKVKPEFSIPEIALRYVYEGKHITSENSNLIAKEFGHNSGHKLYLDFNRFSRNSNRTGEPNPYTKKKMLNKIEQLENVICVLPEKFKPRAVADLETLKTIMDNKD